MLKYLIPLVFLLILAYPSYASAVVMQILPNETNNLAYKNTTNVAGATSCKGMIATSAFSSANVKSVNVSDSDRYQQGVTLLKLTAKCNDYLFTYNLTAAGLNTTNMYNITIGHLGYFDISTADDGHSYLYYFNNTSVAWVNGLELSESETLSTIFFSNSTNASNVWNKTSGLLKFGILQTCADSGTGSENCYSYSNLAYVNVTYENGVSANTCTYGGSGNWFINIDDNCTLSSANIVTGNIYIYGSNGWLNFQAVQKAHAYYYNVTSGGTWWYNNFRVLY